MSMKLKEGDKMASMDIVPASVHRDLGRISPEEQRIRFFLI